MGPFATGSVLILFSGFCFVAAVWREMKGIAPRPDIPRLHPTLLLAVNGFLLLVVAAALIGVWTAGR